MWVVSVVWLWFFYWFSYFVLVGFRNGVMVLCLVVCSKLSSISWWCVGLVLFLVNWLNFILWCSMVKVVLVMMLCLWWLSLWCLWKYWLIIMLVGVVKCSRCVSILFRCFRWLLCMFVCGCGVLCGVGLFCGVWY